MAWCLYVAIGGGGVVNVLNVLVVGLYVVGYWGLLEAVIVQHTFGGQYRSILISSIYVDQSTLGLLALLGSLHLLAFCGVLFLFGSL